MTKKKNGKAGGKVVNFDQHEETDVVDGFVERKIDEPISGGSSSRIVIYTTPEGEIDWDKTKPEIKDRLVSVVTEDSQMLESLAAHPDFQDDGTGTAGVDGWAPTEAGVVLDVLAKLEGLAAGLIVPKLLGQRLEQSTAAQAFEITEEEHTRQDPLGAALMNQYLPINPEWKNLTLFLTAHSASVIRNVREAIKLQMVKDGDMEAEPVRKPTVVEGTIATPKVQ